MKVFRVLIFQVINFIVFVGIRYLSAIAAILAGIGASDHYKTYGRFVYLPSSFIQVVVLTLYYLNSKGNLAKMNAKIAIVVILVLTLLSFLEIIPGEIITLDKIFFFFK